MAGIGTAPRGFLPYQNIRFQNIEREGAEMSGAERALGVGEGATLSSSRKALWGCLWAHIGVLVMGAAFPSGVSALTITFDDTVVLAPPSSLQAVPGGEFGPFLTMGPLTLDGGIIALAITPSDRAATTPPNFYGTTDFLPLSDGTVLPGEITGALAIPGRVCHANRRQWSPVPCELHADGS